MGAGSVIPNESAYGASAFGGIGPDRSFSKSPYSPAVRYRSCIELKVTPDLLGSSVPVVSVGLHDQFSLREQKVGLPAAKHSGMHIEFQSPLFEFIIKHDFNRRRPLRKSLLKTALPHLLPEFWRRASKRRLSRFLPSFIRPHLAFSSSQFGSCFFRDDPASVNFPGCLNGLGRWPLSLLRSAHPGSRFRRHYSAYHGCANLLASLWRLVTTAYHSLSIVAWSS